MRENHKRYIDSELSKAPWNATNDYMNATARNTRLMKLKQAEVPETSSENTDGRIPPPSINSNKPGNRNQAEPSDSNMTVKEATEFLKTIGVSSAVVGFFKQLSFIKLFSYIHKFVC